MIAKPKKKEFSAAQVQSIASASAKQTGRMSSPKTYDAEFPVFDVPVNQKLLVYIPNHTMTHEDGSIGLRMDNFMCHSVRDGKAYGQIRCAGGIIDEANNLDGSCPLCNATQYCWELYNKQYSEICLQKGIPADSPDAEEVLKEDRKKLLDEMAIKAPEKFYTFPIVVIECEEGTTKPKLSSDGKLQGKPYFYTIREATYNEKWEAGFVALEDRGEDVDHNPAGRWATLNFTYTPKSGQHNKRDSARALKVTFIERNDLAEWANYYDKLTENWDIEKMLQVLVANAYRDMSELEAEADRLIKPTLDRIALYNLGTTATIGTTAAPANGAGNTANAEAALANFGAKEITEVSGNTGVEVSAPEIPAQVAQPTAPVQPSAPTPAPVQAGAPVQPSIPAMNIPAAPVNASTGVGEMPSAPVQ